MSLLLLLKGNAAPLVVKTGSASFSGDSSSSPSPKANVVRPSSALLSSSAALGRNLAANGDFETSIAPTISFGVTLSRVTDNPFMGAYALRADFSAAGPADQYVYTYSKNNLALPAKTPFSVGTYVRGPGQIDLIRVYVNFSDGTYEVQTYQPDTPFVVGTSWRYLSASFVPIANKEVASFEAVFLSATPKTQTLWFDALQIQTLDTGFLPEVVRGAAAALSSDSNAVTTGIRAEGGPRTTVFLDTFTAADFTRADARLPDISDAGWVRHNDSSPGVLIEIRGTRAVGLPAANTESVVYYAGQPVTDPSAYDVEADLVYFGATGFAQLLTRVLAANYTWYSALLSPASSTIQLRRVINGNAVVLGDAPISLFSGATFRVKLEVRPWGIALWVDGVEVATSSDTALTSGAAVGMSWSGNVTPNSTVRIDNVSIKEIAETHYAAAAFSGDANLLATPRAWRTWPTPLTLSAQSDATNVRIAALRGGRGTFSSDATSTIGSRRERNGIPQFSAAANSQMSSVALRGASAVLDATGSVAASGARTLANAATFDAESDAFADGFALNEFGLPIEFDDGFTGWPDGRDILGRYAPTGQYWARSTVSTDALTLDAYSGRVRGAGGVDNASRGVYHYFGHYPDTDEYDVEATVYYAGHTGAFWLLGRSNGGLTHYAILVNDDGFYLQRYISGNGINLASYGANPVIGRFYTLKLELRDAAKRMYVNGTLVGQSTDNAITGFVQSGMRFSGNFRNAANDPGTSVGAQVQVDTFTVRRIPKTRLSYAELFGTANVYANGGVAVEGGAVFSADATLRASSRATRSASPSPFSAASNAIVGSLNEVRGFALFSAASDAARSAATVDRNASIVVSAATEVEAEGQITTARDSRTVFDDSFSNPYVFRELRLENHVPDRGVGWRRQDAVSTLNTFAWVKPGNYAVSDSLNGDAVSYALLDQPLTDEFDVELDVDWKDRGSTNVNDKFIVYFRAQGFSASSSSYSLIYDDIRISLRRVIAGNATTLGSVDTNGISPFYQTRVEMRNNYKRVYINGRLVISSGDNTIRGYKTVGVRWLNIHTDNRSALLHRFTVLNADLPAITHLADAQFRVDGDLSIVAERVVLGSASFSSNADMSAPVSSRQRRASVALSGQGTATLSARRNRNARIPLSAVASSTTRATTIQAVYAEFSAETDLASLGDLTLAGGIEVSEASFSGRADASFNASVNHTAAIDFSVESDAATDAALDLTSSAQFSHNSALRTEAERSANGYLDLSSQASLVLSPRRDLRTGAALSGTGTFFATTRAFVLGGARFSGTSVRNLLPNGGFDRGLAGWSPVVFDPEWNPTFALDTATKMYGPASLRIDVGPNTAFRWSQAWFETEIPGAFSNRTFSFSGAVRASNGQLFPQVQVFFLDSEGYELDGYAAPEENYGSIGEWERFGVGYSMDAPEGTVAIRITCLVQAEQDAPQGSVWFDALQLEEGNEITPVEFSPTAEIGVRVAQNILGSASFSAESEGTITARRQTSASVSFAADASATATARRDRRASGAFAAQSSGSVGTPIALRSSSVLFAATASASSPLTPVSRSAILSLSAVTNATATPRADRPAQATFSGASDLDIVTGIPHIAAASFSAASNASLSPRFNLAGSGFFDATASVVATARRDRRGGLTATAESSALIDAARTFGGWASFDAASAAAILGGKTQRASVSLSASSDAAARGYKDLRASIDLEVRSDLASLGRVALGASGRFTGASESRATAAVTLFGGASFSAGSHLTVAGGRPVFGTARFEGDASVATNGRRDRRASALFSSDASLNGSITRIITGRAAMSSESVTEILAASDRIGGLSFSGISDASVSVTRVRVGAASFEASTSLVATPYLLNTVFGDPIVVKQVPKQPNARRVDTGLRFEGGVRNPAIRYLDASFRLQRVEVSSSPILRRIYPEGAKT